MRLLLAIHNAYTDHTSGAAQSMRILMQWMADAGHDVHVLASARFDAGPPANILRHLAEHEIEARRSPAPKAFVKSLKRRSANLGPGRPTLDFTLRGVAVTMLLTTAPPNTAAEQFEGDEFVFLLDRLLDDFAPQVVLTYGSHPVIREMLRRSRSRGAKTVFSLRNHGYEDPAYYENVDHVLTTSPYLSQFYRERIGLESVGINSPIDWAQVESPHDSRRFVTFVNPSPHKGSLLFARLADMLGSRRPDIPIMVVQSATSAAPLNAIPGVDFSRYPQIVAAPATPSPAAFFALTKLLLVPSTFPEPFGRVAAEALINGVPPIVSNRGALPETVGGGGTVLPLPDWLTPDARDLPSETEARPWFDAVCTLWDDPVLYAQASARARAFAEEHYHERVMRAQYFEYFESLGTGGHILQ